jgi:hypothetical protein
LRSELLEIFVVEKSQTKSPTHSPGSSVGRVGLRCVHCAMARKVREDRDEAPMAVFYPKSIAEIYRLVTSWQRCHLRKCRSLPPSVRQQWQVLRESDKSRGKTHYWVTSAKQIGLVDCVSRAGGVRFGPNTMTSSSPKNEEPTTTAEPAPATSTGKDATMEEPMTEVSAVWIDWIEENTRRVSSIFYINARFTYLYTLALAKWYRSLEIVWVQALSLWPWNAGRNESSCFD